MNKLDEKEITLEDVLDVMMKEGITAGLELEKLRIKQLEQKAYDQGYIDSRF
tara:strand:- start:417 stop:572 length:156 start_codon:yes stop_codon:yes gene_type:complete